MGKAIKSFSPRSNGVQARAKDRHPIRSLLNYWPAIRREAIGVRDRGRVLDIDRDGKTHAQVAEEVLLSGPGWVKFWGSPANWLFWGICIEDEYLLEDVGMPDTVSMLRDIQGLKVAAVSWIKPQSALPVHSHPELAGDCLTYHLGLDVPPGCNLVTRKEDGTECMEPEENGKSIVFDGSGQHYAFNSSLRDRLILYCEFRP